MNHKKKISNSASPSKTHSTFNDTLSTSILFQILNEKGPEALINFFIENSKKNKTDKPHVSKKLSTFAHILLQINPKTSLLLALKAIEIDSENITALLLAGTIHDKLGERKDAANCMRTVVLSPLSNPEQVLRASNLLVRFGQHQEALISAKKAFNQLGKPIHLASQLLYIAKLTADWECVEELKFQLKDAYNKGLCEEIGETPRTHLLWCADEATNMKVIKNWSLKTIHSPQKILTPNLTYCDQRRIRLAYLSSDFRDHPTSRLIIGMLKNHDRMKFELFMYCSGWNDQSELRKNIESQFEHIHSVSHLSDENAAHLINSHKIDVLVELNGPTRAHRMGILAYRPAPVQIDYLGWPGSVGGRVVDYIIGDEYTIPKTSEIHYPEKIIKLSKTYQINDFSSHALPQKPSRKSLGLPDGDYLILGMFNAINKVDSVVWETWMKILKAVPNALMWLLDPGPVACSFIAKHTRLSGVDVKRIVIAPRMKQDAHLARIQCCDLMLDPWPYGGHTSTSDALFARVPVIALRGTNFASRVSGGLLFSAGMGTMVQPDLNSYVAKAIHLLRNPSILQAAKIYLKDKTPNSNLFNSKSKTLNFENSLIKILSDDSRASSDNKKLSNDIPPTIWFNISLSQNSGIQPFGISRTEIQIIKNMVQIIGNINHGFIEFKNNIFQNTEPKNFHISKYTNHFNTFKMNDIIIDFGIDLTETYFQKYENLKHEYNIRVICICYDLIPLLFPQYTTEKTSLGFTRFLHNLNKGATDILFISDKTRDDFENYARSQNFNNFNSSVIKLGSNISPMKEIIAESYSFYELTKQPYILFVSTIERRKNHETLYRAYHLLCQQGKKMILPNLIFVGAKGWGVTDLFKDIELDPIIKGKIFILSEINDSHLEYLYRNCIFTLYPSLYEGWGLPVAESLSFGKFVLCSDRGSLPEVGKDLVSYIDPWNVAKWAEEIEKYVTNFELLNNKEINIKKNYKSLSWKDTAQQILDHVKGRQ